MPRLPDQFDLMIRRARQHQDPARRLDLALGTLFGQSHWHLLNAGTQTDPQPALVESDGDTLLLLFSGLDQLDDFTVDAGRRTPQDPLPVITIPTHDAIEYTLRFRVANVAGLCVNPGDYGFIAPFPILEKFHQDWLAHQAHHQARGTRAIGFWIPNMTTEEQDFWAEHDL